MLLCSSFVMIMIASDRLPRKSADMFPVAQSIIKGALVAQWVKGWPTDLADQVRFPLKVKSFQPLTELHSTQPFIINLP